MRYDRYFKEIEEEYKETVKDYEKFKGKVNEKNKNELLFSLKLLNVAINKLRAYLKNLYFGGGTSK